MTVDTALFTAEELQQVWPLGVRHGPIAARVAIHLGAYVRRHHLGRVCVAEAGFVLMRDPDALRMPDISFVGKDGTIPGTPDLSIDFISPSDLASERIWNRLQSLRAGTRAVVEVDPQNRIVYVHRSLGTNMGTTIAENVLEVDDVVPGWKMPLAEIFE